MMINYVSLPKQQIWYVFNRLIIYILRDESHHTEIKNSRVKERINARMNERKLQKEKEKMYEKKDEKKICVKEVKRKGDINQHHSNTHIFHFIVLINGRKFLLKFPVLDLSAMEFMWIKDRSKIRSSLF